MVATNQQLAGDANDQDRLFALLAYIIGWLVSLIILVSESNKSRPFQKFHAVNALALDVAWYVIFTVCCVLSTVLAAFTFGLGGCLLFVPLVAWLVLKIWYGVLAYQGKYFDIPYLTKFCRDQHWI